MKISSTKSSARRAFVVFAAIITCLAVCVGVAWASTKRVIIKEDTWSTHNVWAAPNLVGTGTHVEGVLVTVTIDTLFWPDGDYVNKIGPFMVTLCYNIDDRAAGQSNGVLFQGVNARAYFFDDNNDYLMPQIDLDDKGDHGCTSEVLPDSGKQWYKMSESPGYQLDGSLRIKYSPDQELKFRWGGSETKYFHPDTMESIGNYYDDNNANWGIGPE